MDTEWYEAWVCDDCLMVLANGDSTGISDENLEQVLAGVEVFGNAAIGDDCDEFSRSGCDCCKDWRAGRRSQVFTFE